MTLNSEMLGRHRSRDDLIFRTLREGEKAFSERAAEPPIVLWVDDDRVFAAGFSNLKYDEEVECYIVSDEHEIVSLLRGGHLPVHRLACIVQDMTRPRGSFATTIGRYRKNARNLFPLNTASGDLAFYLRDQFYPASSMVIHSGSINLGDGLVEKWAEQALNVHVIDKPARTSDVASVVNLAIRQFSEAELGRPVSEEGRMLLPVAEELASITALDQSILERILPRNFEEMIASIFTNHGFTTALTQQSRDGGYDLMLLSPRGSNSKQILVECKKFSPHRCVDVGIVRALYGVKTLRKASSAYLVTSSYVSAYAKREFETVMPIEMNFFERHDVLRWCEQHMNHILSYDDDKISSADDSITATPID